MSNFEALGSVFSKNAICFGLDNRYVKYFSVVLQSFITIANPKTNYDLVVLHNDITEANKKKLIKSVTSNISLKFFNINETKNKFIEYGKFKPKGYWPESMYYRLLIPEIFQQYEKVLYCDSDIVFNENIDELFDIDFETKKMLVVTDSVVPELQYDRKRKIFIENYLGLNSANNYFNSGIILFNIKAIDKNIYFDKLTIALNKYDNLLFPDQDILNKIFENQVKYISQIYNFQVNIPIYQFKHMHSYPQSFLKDYYCAEKKPKIIHYAGGVKPWHNPSYFYHDYFWKEARKTPFYEEIIYENYNEKLQLILSKNSINHRYIKAKILSKITFGKTRNKYKEERIKLKRKVQIIRNIIKESLQ